MKIRIQKNGIFMEKTKFFGNLSGEIYKLKKEFKE